MGELKVSPASLGRLTNAAKAVEDAKAELKKARQEFAAAVAPVKIGDIIPVTGYAHRDKRMVVDSVSAQIAYRSFREEFKTLIKATGRVLKKDGTPGLQSGESYWEVEAEENT